MQQDLADFGASAEQLAHVQVEAEADEQDDHFEVLPANWLAVQIFNDLGGQWRVRGTTPISIDRAALQASIELWPVEAQQRSDTFHRVRVMEAVAAEEFRRRANSG